LSVGAWNLKLDQAYTPIIAVVIPTYNEAKLIRDKLNNLLQQVYPHDKLHLIVIDSASTDGTPEAEQSWIQEHPHINATLLREPIRRGMVPALNYALKHIPGDAEVVIFTDVDSFWTPDTLRNITKYIADPTVGAVDVEPEPYMSIAERCGVKVVKRDLERERLDIRGADCAVFTEVIEHLHYYYYVPHVLSEINKSLKPGGYLILTTPNIASLFRRLRLILGKQPIYQYHVREYTASEVLTMLEEAGFKPVEFYYSAVNDLTYVNAEPEDYKRLRGYAYLLKLAIKKPTKLNLLLASAYPLVKLIPSLRMLIVVISQKYREPAPTATERWG